MRSLLAFALLVAACGSSSSPSTSAGAQPGTVDLHRVFDGDSFEVEEPGREVRLLGVNAPERFDCLGDEAASRLAAILGEGDLVLEGPSETDQFGRELRYVEVNGSDAGEVMLGLGLAVATSEAHPRRDLYRAAEATAVAERIGMWAVDACGKPRGAAVVISTLEFDAPGDDAAKPNGEWLIIRNEGADAVRLGGWALRDESSRHRYEFPTVTLEPGTSLRVFSGCGEDRASVPRELYWCADGAVWNNSGDTALLLDPSGNVVDRVVYGAKS